MTESNTHLTVAVVQCPLPGPKSENLERVEHWVREAASTGAQLVVTPELFEGPYFPQSQNPEFFATAQPREGHPTVERFAALAKSLSIAMPVSFFEQSGPHYFNSVAMLDADGSTLGYYRKAHIPDGPGYTEKFYFRPGDTAFQVFRTRFANVGVAICWDQWFPEVARALTLAGADVLAYPTAIGNEPSEPEVDTSQPWRRAMQGHAVSNAVVVAAANRVGAEDNMSFYGTSFVSDPRGDIVAEVARDAEGVALTRVDLTALRQYRASWGFFRDRRPDLYQPLVRCEPDDAANT